MVLARFNALIFLFTILVLFESSLAIQASDQASLLSLAQHWSILTTQGWSSSNATLACTTPWAGLICSPDGNVTGISLANFGLSGPIPDAVGGFAYLSYLNLSNNNLGSTIPDSLGNLAATLTVLDLSYDGLTGNVPSIFAFLQYLVTLNLNGNSLSLCPPPPWNDSPLNCNMSRQSVSSCGSMCSVGYWTCVTDVIPNSCPSVPSAPSKPKSPTLSGASIFGVFMGAVFIVAVIAILIFLIAFGVEGKLDETTKEMDEASRAAEAASSVANATSKTNYSRKQKMVDSSSTDYSSSSESEEKAAAAGGNAGADGWLVGK